MNDQRTLSTVENIGRLLYRRLNDAISLTEEIELNNWLAAHPGRQQYFEEVMEPENIEKALKEMFQYDEEGALCEVQRKIEVLHALDTAPIVSELDDTVNPTNPVTREDKGPTAPRRRYRWLIPVTISLIVFVVFAFTHSKRKTTSIPSAPLSQRYKNDIAPGSDKAILQLADGSTIVLDNAQNGQLAQEGAIKITKLGKGRLTYENNTSIENSGANAGYNIISTPRAGQYEVVLPDGSKVWLNSSSSLRYPTAFTGPARSVELQGEAFFEIEKSPSKPFIVKVARPQGQAPLQVEVLGTSFNVRAYQDEQDLRTTLFDGGVRVGITPNAGASNVSNAVASNPTASNTASQSITLTPGQQARLDNNTAAGKPSLISGINTDEVIAWKKGLFQFHDASIQDIMRQVSRWYDVEVVYKENPDQQFIGTIPRQTSLSSLLLILESTGWVHFTIEGREITVFR